MVVLKMTCKNVVTDNHNIIPTIWTQLDKTESEWIQHTRNGHNASTIRKECKKPVLLLCDWSPAIALKGTEW